MTCLKSFLWLKTQFSSKLDSFPVEKHGARHTRHAAAASGQPDRRAANQVVGDQVLDGGALWPGPAIPGGTPSAEGVSFAGVPQAWQ